MSIQKQIDAMIDWKVMNKPLEKWIEVKITPAELSKFGYRIAGKYYYRDFELRLKK